MYKKVFPATILIRTNYLLSAQENVPNFKKIKVNGNVFSKF